MGVKLIIIGKEEDFKSEADFEKVKAAMLDSTIQYLDIDNRLIKKTMISEVIDTEPKFQTPEAQQRYENMKARNDAS